MKQLSIALLALILMTGCKKADTNSCATPSFTVSPVSGGSIQISLNGGGSYGFLNIEYGNNGFTKGTGTKATMGPGGGYQYTGNGTFDVYVQGNCGGTSNSDWAGPQSVLVNGAPTVGNCEAPDNLVTYVSGTDVHVTWYKPYNISGTAIYQLRYDTAGFPTGGGTLQTVNGESYYITSLPRANTTYDYMVRGKCDDGNWGPWSIRKSFYVTTFSTGGGCTGPSYVNATSAGGGVENFSWDAGGASTFEYDWNTNNATPTNPRSGAATAIGAYTFYSGTTYYFFVRGVCANNTKTAWKTTSFTY